MQLKDYNSFSGTAPHGVPNNPISARYGNEAMSMLLEVYVDAKPVNSLNTDNLGEMPKYYIHIYADMPTSLKEVKTQPSVPVDISQ